MLRGESALLVPVSLQLGNGYDKASLIAKVIRGTIAPVVVVVKQAQGNIGSLAPFYLYYEIFVLADVQSVFVSPASKTIFSCPHHSLLFVKEPLFPNGRIEGLPAQREGGGCNIDGAVFPLTPGTLICGGQQCRAICKGLDTAVGYLYDILVVVRIRGKSGNLIRMSVGIVCCQFQIVRTSRKQSKFAVLGRGEPAQRQRLFAIV